MEFWWFMLGCGLLIPAMMIGMGWWMWKHPPKKINALCGYRTTLSMKNADTWAFAHAVCGRLWWRMGWVALLPSAAALLPVLHGSQESIGALGAILCTVQCALLLGSIVVVERALRREFHPDGTRKQRKEDEKRDC